MERDDWNERYRARELVWTVGPAPLVEAETADLPPGRALDLAAGRGRNAVWLAERGWDVTAVDQSSVALGQARQLAGIRGVSITTEVADVTTYEPAAGAFDLALICYLHIPADDRRAAVAHATAALAPGGTLVMVGHDRSNHGRGAGGPSTIDVLVTAAQVRDLLEAAGLAVARAEVVERPVETSEGPRLALDHVVVGTRVGG